jgi:hypothetical protein
MPKLIVLTAIVSLFLVSGVLFSLALLEGSLYSELLALEQEHLEECQIYLCMSGPVLFPEKHLSNLIIYLSVAAATAAGGIVLFIKRHKWLANNGSARHQESNS